ncbi:7,8-didemethyl-8-hydroxy-5-deazariboflavin synthase subunit CofG [Methanolapillus millepedarum]|uniref:7,8-didemethyl-8-hydroxy-5-deazariboflavin synthase n=1 Tax=Methanolapillus millepedarum TaxID=3028296 RepID=A0AA96ZVM9_9EURY|nr:FO synthase [Methanosarcinaceae archaeon Ac7]
MKPITFSKNVFIPVTNVCRNRCAYCGFRREVGDAESFLMTEDDVVSILRAGVLAGCTEALFTFGEYPEEDPVFLERLEKIGFSSLSEYVARLSDLALEIGILPHTNGGVLSFDDLKRLAPKNASMGLMLETTANISAHRNCPGKDPAVRLEMIKNAGILQIPLTTGLLIGIGESRADRVDSIQKIAALHERYGHIQEVILQNYSPKPNLAKDAARKLGLCPPSREEMIDTILMSRQILPADVAVQVAPNLIPPLDLIRYGVSDLGGISPVTIDYINPEAAWPKIDELRTTLRSGGYEFKERLPIHPDFVLKGRSGKETKPLVAELADENGYRKTKTI